MKCRCQTSRWIEGLTLFWAEGGTHDLARQRQTTWVLNAGNFYFFSSLTKKTYKTPPQT